MSHAKVRHVANEWTASTAEGEREAPESPSHVISSDKREGELGRRLLPLE